MNLRLLACLGLGAFTTYMGLVMLIGHFHTIPKGEPPLPRNFSSRAEEVVDQTTGEKTTYREITVSTKLNDPQDPARPVARPAMSVEELQIGLSR